MGEPAAWIALGGFVLLLAWIAALTFQLRRYTRLRQRLLHGASVSDVEVLLAELLERADHMEGRQRELERFRDAAARMLEASLVAPHVVRYDAYENIAGSQSFTVVLLDRHGTGLMLTSLVGREGGRLYVKPLRDGVSAVALSDEESAVLHQALAALHGAPHDSNPGAES